MLKASALASARNISAFSAQSMFLGRCQANPSDDLKHSEYHASCFIPSKNSGGGPFAIVESVASSSCGKQNFARATIAGLWNFPLSMWFRNPCQSVLMSGLYRSRFLGHGYSHIRPELWVATFSDRRSTAKCVRRILRATPQDASGIRRSPSSCGLRPGQQVSTHLRR